MLYMDPITRAGYSMADDVDLPFTDLSASKSMFKALQNFLDMYKEKNYKSIWVAGKGYGGVSAPYLAYQIH